MTRLSTDSRGAMSILLIIFVIALSYGVYALFFKEDSPQDMNTPVTTSETSDNVETVADDSHQKIISLQSVNGYSAQGKAVINEDKFGMFSLQLSLALPSEFETTFYGAQLRGNRTINLGKLSRVGGLYKLEYTSNETLSVFNSIVIIVDGDATTVEGKTLPHDVMVGELN